MVAAVRRGVSQRKVARQFGVALSTVQGWVKRAEGHRLDRVDWRDRSHGPHRTRRTALAVEDFVLRVRQELQDDSDLGEYGAEAIRRELEDRGRTPCPSVRTIGRILERRGVLDGRKRIRRPPPSRGWYLPSVGTGEAELDSFDTIEGLAIRGGPHLSVLTGISLHGGLAAAWPQAKVTSRDIVTALMTHWREVGLPAYAQFDNDNRFQGPHQHADCIGRVIRLCLSLGVTPVFVPPQETGFQAAIESFNGRWQAKVWTRFEHQALRELQGRSTRYIVAVRRRSAPRIDSAPKRRQIPEGWCLDLQARPKGTIIYLRRTNDRGSVRLLGHNFTVHHHWPHRLVRAEVDLDASMIRYYALRRREPRAQPLLNHTSYELPNRRFKE